MKNIWSNENLIKILNEGGVVVMPTDTIYGVVGKALNEDVVDRIYTIKNRNRDKPLIILIGDIKELKKFSISLSEEQKKVVMEYWPGPVSIILDCFSPEFEYLHRGIKTLSFRLPSLNSLRNLLLKTGPLIATSANTEGLPPCKNIEEAKKYFGNLIDLYVEGKAVSEKHSKLIKLNDDNSTTILRE